MSKQPEPYLFLKTLGAPAPENDREGSLEILRWFQEYGTPPIFADETNPLVIMQHYLEDPEAEWRKRIGNLMADIQVSWRIRCFLS